jgi:glutamyl-tRNA reductase
MDRGMLPIRKLFRWVGLALLTVMIALPVLQVALREFTRFSFIGAGELTRFMLATGLRLGEALGVRWSDLDLERGTLSVERTVIRLRGGGLVASRLKTRTSARVLACAWSARLGDWAELPHALETADLVILATAASAPVVTARQLTSAMQARSGRGLLVIDLALPRNVEPAARTVDGIQLIDLDDLQSLSCPATAAGSPALIEAEAVLEEELLRLGQNLRRRNAAPRLAELHRSSLEMAEEESAWALAQLESLSESEREIVRQMADRLVRRVLYPVSRSLRDS